MMTTLATATIEGTGTKPADVVVRGNASGFLQEIGLGGMHIESLIEEGGKSRSAEIGPLKTPANLER
jgi:hypothetical protein